MSPSKVDNSETPSQPAATTYSTSPALVAFTLAVVVICFVGFSVVYFCRCYFASFMHTWAFQRTASGTIVRLSNNNQSPNRGLDSSLLQSFPSFLYSSVKNLRKEKNYSLECAICLLEFEEDSMLRLLTVCYHVFHQECIDLWLSSHKTCPVCRKDLEYSPTNETRKSQEVAEDNLRVVEESRDHVCIEVKEEEGEGEDQRHDDVAAVVSMKEQGEQRFARSHSTGHSIVMIRGGDEGKDDEKYTLRLPEHVALKFVRGGHNCTKSCSSYKDMVAARPAGTCIC